MGESIKHIEIDHTTGVDETVAGAAGGVAGTAGVDRWWSRLPLIARLDRLRLDPAVTFLVGENGCGKSTLLEAITIACGFNPEGGNKNLRFRTRASHSSLHEALTVVWGPVKPRGGFFLRAEGLSAMATAVEQLDVDIAATWGGSQILHEQSHGEAVLSVLSSRF